MVLLELFAQGITGILIGYLALTNTLAHAIESLLPPLDAETAIKVEAERPNIEEYGNKASNEVTVKQPTYEYGGPIPRILLENTEYQRAAASSPEPTEPNDVPFDSLPLKERVEQTLVNVYCQYKTDEHIRTTTGTGYFISPNGVVLTNAHVAQFLLLEDASEKIRDTRCTLRVGNPAEARYEAELLYISPAWIHENAKLVTEAKPRGTGERDYALLYVAKPVDGKVLPEKYPVVPLDIELLPRSVGGNEVLAAGYPAEVLMRDGAHATITPMVASTTIGELYTFGSNYADIFSLTDSVVGEQGASGGPIVNTSGSAIGLIVTKGNDELEGKKSLRALTLSYINRTIIEETGFSLAHNMQGDLAFRGSIFKQALAPFLSRLLVFEFN